jgi:uncharacterized protein YcfJ
MGTWAVVLGILVLGTAVLATVVSLREHREGIRRFGSFSLKGDQIAVGSQWRDITRDTHAEVHGSVQQGRRSTVTRTAAGAVVGGVPGALVGHTAKKKTRNSSATLTVNGPDWTYTADVPADRYQEAVRFAQAVNLAARTSR